MATPFFHRNSLAQEPQDEADRGDDWWMNSTPGRVYDQNADVLSRLPQSKWAPWTDGLPIDGSQTPTYQPFDIMNRLDFPPGKTRQSY